MSKFSLKSTACPLFGHPKDLREFVLPRKVDIILCCNEERRLMGKKSKNNKEPKFCDIAKIVAQKVMKLYRKVTIPYVCEKRILQLIKVLHDKYRRMKIYSNNSKKKDSAALNKKINDFKQSCGELFDIAKCKCTNFTDCRCPQEDKVPRKIQPFLYDQRNDRKKCMRSFVGKKTVS